MFAASVFITRQSSVRTLTPTSGPGTPGLPTNRTLGPALSLLGPGAPAASMMSSEHTEEGIGPAAESNEHDYAHAVHGTEPDPSFCSPHPQELPGPTVCSEVEVLIEPYEPAPASRGPRRSRVPHGPRGFVRRPQELSCRCCRQLFQRQGRCFNRRAVYTFTTPDTVRWLFPSSQVNDKSFLCETCAQVVRSSGRRRVCGKRSLWLKPPTPKKEKLTRRMGNKSKAALLISKSNYKAAFQTLWSSKGARKPMMEFWSKELKNEMKELSRQPDNPFHQKVSGRKPLTCFPWRQCLNWAQEKAPLVVTCLRSMFPDINALYKSNHQLSEEQAATLLERRTVVALSIPLFTRNIWRNNFLQAALGAELKQQGCSGSALDTLNTLGLCQNKDTVRLLLQRLSNGTHDAEPGLMTKPDQMGEVTTDEEEEDEEEEISALKQEDDDEGDILLGVEEEEIEQEEVQDRLQDEDDPALMEKEEEKKKRRKRKAKKQRKQEKRTARGKRMKMEEEDDDDEDESEQKKKVVVVRLGLLKGTSEVGRSDLSAP